MKAGIISRTDIQEAIAVTRAIVGYLDFKGVDVHVERETSQLLKVSKKGYDLSEMDVDFMVTVGGDGTILRAAMAMQKPETPILGVNLGRRGFLAEISPEGLEEALDRVLVEDYHLEECIKLSSRCPEMDKVFPDSLNEVLVTTPVPSKVLEMSLRVNSEPFIDIQADGVLVATPTGSTAYNLSAGGSILAPEVPAMILTTICPYSYFHSIVAPITSRIRIKLLKPNTDGLAIIDGSVQSPLKPDSTVEVWASPHRARFIRFSSFYGRLERRLSFRHFK